MILLVDANNLFMRAWFATQHEAMTADGESTAAMVVFVNTLTRHLREERPERVVVCWDGGGSDYRLRLSPSYKANRREKAEDSRASRERRTIKEFLSLANIFHVERPGVEADDLIAKYWHDADEDVVVVSEDKDFLMLAGPTPRGSLVEDGVCKILRSTGERWDEADVHRKMGAPPQHLPSVMALTGDTSDNVIGVPGIGPVRAVQLLEEAGWYLRAIEDPRVREMLPQVLTNRVLVNLRLPLPGLELAAPPYFAPTRSHSALYPELLAFLDRYQLKGLTARLLTTTLWDDGSRTVDG
jgi:DNA polymerase-1